MEGEGMHFIGGDFIAASSGSQYELINPATEEVCGKAAKGDARDVDLAVRAANAALPGWRQTTGAQRATIMREIAELVKGAKAELARVETMDCGKPFPESEWDMDDVAGCFEYFASEAEKLDSMQRKSIDVGDADYKCHIKYEPCGVVGAIVPSNYPLLMATWKLAPALAAGCCVVLKPHEFTPRTAIMLGGLLRRSKLPPGVINFVTGFGADVGGPLINHPDVHKLAFTGSGPTGRLLGKRCAELTKGISLELGGKSPVVVFEDASELDKVVEWVMFGCFWTNGQICSATSRLVIHSSIADRFLAKLVAEAQRIKISADTMDPESRLGPLVSQAALDKALRMVDEAKAEGGAVLCGGKRPAHLSKGFFLEPTVVKVTPGMKLWNEEVFAPVLAVATFDTEEEALRLANSTDYGLGSAVFSASQERLDRFEANIEAGIVWKNCSQPCFSQLPWGGVKQSGTGRELGPWGIHNYLEQKSVVQYVNTGAPLGWYSFQPKL